MINFVTKITNCMKKKMIKKYTVFDIWKMYTKLEMDTIFQKWYQDHKMETINNR